MGTAAAGIPFELSGVRGAEGVPVHGLNCDRCDKTLLLDEDVRYEVRIVVQAAYDPMEITRADLESSSEGDWRRLIEKLETLSAEEAQNQIYRELQFDLCPGCQKDYLRQPIPSG